MYGQLNHFDYKQLDEKCGCFVCGDWRTKHAVYHEALQKIATHNSGRGCGCIDCKAMYSARSAYLAALSRRDLYCEGSYHAARDPALGQPFMEWLGHQVREVTPAKQGWWENTAPYLTLSSWFGKFHRSSGTACVSGMAA